MNGNLRIRRAHNLYIMLGLSFFKVQPIKSRTKKNFHVVSHSLSDWEKYLWVSKRWFLETDWCDPGAIPPVMGAKAAKEYEGVRNMSTTNQISERLTIKGWDPTEKIFFKIILEIQFLKTVLCCFHIQNFVWELNYKNQFSQPIFCEDTMYISWIQSLQPSLCFQLFPYSVYKTTLKIP